eukprot:CAMPEP_0170457192 /NCGR_PEP_ID=MMETSP0123-20130129/4570_1 /TAXON_ID=182087 /ORGANISM="Favella ehrenbergii, Strain Fehren 1" /LENGTH=109 /DNA_ID=CAMNT_0010720911 /DNA_START=1420 /DNA_END=1749 /DNA_ORIENTATION=-
MQRIFFKPKFFSYRTALFLAKLRGEGTYYEGTDEGEETKDALFSDLDFISRQIKELTKKVEDAQPSPGKQLGEKVILKALMDLPSKSGGELLHLGRKKSRSNANNMGKK